MKIHFTWVLLGLALTLFLTSHFDWMQSLPKRVATHFDASGRPNGWMTRSGHGLSMVLLGLGIPAFILGICALIRVLPPALLNAPNADYWRNPEHFSEACRFLNVWGRCLASAMLVWNTLLNREVMLANQVNPALLNNTAVNGISIGLVMLILVQVVWLLMRFTRVEKKED